ncbi:hypothetical protein GGI20_002053 [Coemansia sp. BCRC 34301]|nr:hypothetical protein GGI20_002053 [Coemansia sp. BCRC 34301]
MLHIAYTSGSSKDQFVQLVWQCARLLQSLQIHSYDDEAEDQMDASRLIQDADGRYIQYLLLQKLVLNLLHMGSGIVAKVPLPVFGDFQQVFTHDSHPQLKNVVVAVTHELFPVCFRNSASNCVEFLLDIGPKAPLRELLGLPTGDEALRTFRLSTLHQSIQTLNLGNTNLALIIVLKLIEALPQLSVLQSGCPQIGIMFATLHWLELMSVFVMKFVPLSTRFRLWHFEAGEKTSMEMVQCVMLVALVCPNFDYAISSANHQHQFMALARAVIALPGFRDHEQ